MIQQAGQPNAGILPSAWVQEPSGRGMINLAFAARACVDELRDPDQPDKAPMLLLDLVMAYVNPDGSAVVLRFTGDRARHVLDRLQGGSDGPG